MTEEILKWFKEHPNQFVSGEQLSRELGCSRTAVWKHIQSLRKRGYEFESLPRLGYRLVQIPSSLDEKDILAGLKTNAFGRVLHLYPSLNSTQEKAREWAKKGAPEGTVILAEEQTSGRGRMGRKWHSPPYLGIWMSLILRPKIPLRFLSQMTLLTAVSLHRTIKRLYCLEAGIKWPNDLLINGKKVSGILLESSAEEERLQYIVTGIGISANLKESDFPPELRRIATSLYIETGKTIDRAELVRELLQDLESLYTFYLKEGFAPIRTLWETFSVTLGKAIQTNDAREGTIEGIAEGIDEYGALIVRTGSGKTLKIYSGEIHFIS